MLRKTDPKLTHLINQAVISMEENAGLRSGMYLRAAYDYIHNKNTADLECCLETYSPDI